jgi:hypothetical protein
VAAAPNLSQPKQLPASAHFERRLLQPIQKEAAAAIPLSTYSLSVGLDAACLSPA